MDPIRKGMEGAAVEDVQSRLIRLGFTIDADERAHEHFGPSTAQAVQEFRRSQGLDEGDEVDLTLWTTLVSEGYELGDRTLYLRLPNFHGRDVRTLQQALNTLGFSCGEVDGCFDAHTEAAVRQFQENVGAYPDGMCFSDTFEAIWHLHHVWGDERRRTSRTLGFVGFARAASVLEELRVCLTATDPVSRNVAGRVWNLACATSEKSGLQIVNTVQDAPTDATCVFVLTCDAPDPTAGIGNVVLNASRDLPLRLRTAVGAAPSQPPVVSVELPLDTDPYGRFTTNDAQTLAMTFLDALCSAFENDLRENTA